MDGEGGIVKSEETKRYLARVGIRYVPRAPGQQVAHIDRRTALLRDVIHRVVEQHRHEGLDVPFLQVLAECVFAGNALISVNGGTPYQAVYGRVPLMLPDIN
eukprot:8600738-Alexandrium_andersonii.AAC.1